MPLIHYFSYNNFPEVELDTQRLRRLFFSFLLATVIAVFVVCIFRIVNIYLFPSENHPSLHMPRSLGG